MATSEGGGDHAGHEPVEGLAAALEDPRAGVDGHGAQDDAVDDRQDDVEAAWPRSRRRRERRRAAKSAGEGEARDPAVPRRPARPGAGPSVRGPRTGSRSSVRSGEVGPPVDDPAGEMLTARVMTNSARPLAISVFTSRPVDSGNCSAMFAAIVDGLLLLIRLNVIATGAPTARSRWRASRRAPGPGPAWRRR